MEGLDKLADILPHLANPLVLVGFVLFLVFGIHRTLINSKILQPVPESDSGGIVRLLLRYGFILAVLLIFLGFAHAAWTAHLEATPTADFASILGSLFGSERRESDPSAMILILGVAIAVVLVVLGFVLARWKSQPNRPLSFDVDHVVKALIAGHEREREASAERIKELTEAIDDLSSKRKEPDAPPGIEHALEFLGKGEVGPAEAIFARTLQRLEAEGRPSLREAARAARHLGALARFDSATKARDAYRKATELDPDELTGWGGLGDMSVVVGDLPGALDAFQKALEIAEALAARDPDNAGWRRDLSVSHNRIGDVRVAQGDLPGALDAFQKALEIAEALAARDPDNAGWRRDLSVSHNRIGDVRVAQGDLPGALDAFQKALEIAEALAARDPDNAGWRRDLSVSHNKIGDVRVAQGDLPGALDAFQKTLEIAEALAARDPDNAGWRRDLSVSHERIARVAELQGDDDLAVAAFEKARRIYAALLDLNPDNAQFRTFMVVPLWGLGRLLGEDGRPYLREALDTLRALEAANRLDARRKAWIDEIEAALGDG